MLTVAYGHGAKRLAELFHAMRKTVSQATVPKICLIHILDGPSIRADDPVVCGAVRKSNPCVYKSFTLCVTYACR